MEDALAYAQRQSQLWDGPIYVEPIDGSDDALESARESWAVALGEWLKGTTLFRRLLMIFRQAEHDREDPLSWTDLVGRLASADLALKAITDDENRQRVIVSFLCAGVPQWQGVPAGANTSPTVDSRAAAVETGGRRCPDLCLAG